MEVRVCPAVRDYVGGNILFTATNPVHQSANNSIYKMWYYKATTCQPSVYTTLIWANHNKTRSAAYIVTSVDNHSPQQGKL